MPMVTNTCEKHGHAYAEDRCPQCVIEETVAMRAVTQKFFDTHRNRQLNELFDQFDVTLEDLYGHFRVRFFLELEPVLRKISRDSRDLFVTAYNASSR